jgi:mono/diheme cytochrome c family protein
MERWRISAAVVKRCQQYNNRERLAGLRRSPVDQRGEWTTMNTPRLRGLIAWLCLVMHLSPALARAQTTPEQLAGKAREVLLKHCFDCHGKDPKRLSSDLNLFDPAHLADKDRQIVVPRAPADSVLIQRIRDGSMPLGKRPKLSADEQKTLEEWIAAGAAPFPGPKPAQAAAENSVALASQVKEIFRTRCFECHGGRKVNAGVKVLDQDNLVNKKRKVIPGKPDESRLFQVITIPGELAMPPNGLPRLAGPDVEVVRRWIAAGAPAFPADAVVPNEPKREDAFKDVVGVDYVLKKILAHVQEVKNARPGDERFLRYFSINHVLTSGATPAELELQRDALAKAINHLSKEKQIVRPRPIDSPTDSVFVVDLRDLGWDRRPFRRIKGKQDQGESPYNLYDLVLLEYPYGIAYEDSNTFIRLAEDFLIPSGQVRPIPYVRADWFVSTATQPTLYEDLLQLPFTLAELQKQLNVDEAANFRARRVKRAGLTVSGVSRNNRVVEWQPLPGRAGSFSGSADFPGSSGTNNMFKDLIHLKPAGGEFIFTLPNHLQGYFLANGKGERLDSAPTGIVTDTFAADKTVRNGLACMRCHDEGMKGFSDKVRPALQRLPDSPGFDKRAALYLYPEEAVMDAKLTEDGDRFRKAMKEVLGKDSTREPLIPVSQRFLDEALLLRTAAGELGLAKPEGLEKVFTLKSFAALGLMPLAAEDGVRRDSWEDYFDLVVREMGLGIPVVPLDGANRRTFPAVPASIEVDLKTSKRTGVTEPGEWVSILVVNRSRTPIHIELIGTSSKGRKFILATSNTKVEAGQTFTLPPLRVQADTGREQITLFASEAEFPAGELLRGEDVSDRVVHPFYQLQSKDGRVKILNDPAGIVKKTIEIETR